MAELPRDRPVLVFDGDCRFCRIWIDRWHDLTGDAVEYLAQQDPACRVRFPDLDPSALEKAVHLVEPDGRVTRGAEAVLRAMAVHPRWAWLRREYDQRLALAALAESAYAFVAEHRALFSLATRLLWSDSARKPTWWIARELFLGGLAVIHLVAFLSIGLQIDGLIGRDGILPAATYLQGAAQYLDRAGVGWDRYRLLPSLCWFGTGDAFLHGLCLGGVLLAVTALAGMARAPAFLGLWLAYLSLVAVGQDFLSFQWDVLLLEATLLAVFWSPWSWGPRAARAIPPSRVGRWLVVWLLFRLMLESGAVKLLSMDATWHDLTALEFHYRTQPLPGPWAWHAHHLPAWVHRASCALMFGIELGLPWLVWAPRRPRLLAFWGLVTLQGAILLTGNYTFFNLLTLVLCLALVDDATWRRWLRRPAVPFPVMAPHPHPQPLPLNAERGVRSAELGAHGSGPRFLARVGTSERWRRRCLVPVAAVAVLIGGAHLVGLLAPSTGVPTLGLQRWLAPLRSFNSYGLFAVMTTRRLEIVVEGSADGVTWHAYEFRHKPGDVRRRPSQVAPHQPRLDWQMWFAALGEVQDNPWFVRFCARLFEGSPPVLALLEHNPFPDAPPRYLRARLYDYRFATRAERRETGAWWVRREQGLYCLPMTSPTRP